MPEDKLVDATTAEQLLNYAQSARNRAYAPYSRYPVGAAVLTDDGSTFTGVNIENASYGLTMCAERVALFKAISEGHRDIVAVAVVGPEDEVSPPCGSCRQVLAEFNPRMLIIIPTHDSDSGDGYEQISLADLLPRAFGPENLSSLDDEE